MKKYFYNHTLVLLLLFMTFASFGQKKYTSKATSTELILEGKTLVGYKTTFAFEWNEVRKGWWKYAREFGTPLNMKTYYKVTIPSETTDGNVNLEIFTQASETKNGTDFFLGLENDRYKDQAFILMKDFKKKFYINHLIEQIEDNQKKSVRLGGEYKDASTKKRKQELLQQVTQVEKTIEDLKERIRAIEKE